MPKERFIKVDGAGDWRRDASELALACAGSFAADEAARLHEMLALLRACPVELAHGLTLPELVRVEALAAAGAAATAVMELFDGAEAGYLLSRGGGSEFLASVILPGAVAEVSTSGDTAALALLGALAMALAERGTMPVARIDLQVPAGARLN